MPACGLYGTALVICLAFYAFSGQNPLPRTSAAVIVPLAAEEAKAPEKYGVKSAPKEDGPLNINTATALQLRRLPGVGEGLAKRIIAYREANGGFFSTEELLLVRGIGREMLTGLSGYITID